VDTVVGMTSIYWLEYTHLLYTFTYLNKLNPLLFIDVIEVRAWCNCQVTVDLTIAGLLVTSMHIGLVRQRTYIGRDGHFA